MVNKNILVIVLIFFITGALQAQDDTIAISGVEIQAGRAAEVWSGESRVLTVITRNEIASLPVKDLNGLLKYALNADIRNRGNGDVQADVCLRGSSFEQVLILLNGISMNDPQTGHHQLDLPVALEDIERVEVLEGPGSRVFGPNAFAGVINIITGYASGQSVHTALSYGSFATYSGMIASSFRTGILDHYISLYGSGSDGYRINTDYGIGKGYYRASLALDKGEVALAAGWMNKEFGANGFYSPRFPEQYEATRTETGSLNFGYGKKLRVDAKVAWRRHHDRFELFRNDAPSWYGGHNYHMTDVVDAGADISYRSKAGTSSLGAEYSYQHIFSNVLGNMMDDTLSVKGEPDGFFNRSDLRKNIRIYAGHEFSYRRFSVSGGVLVHHTQAFGTGYYPGVDLSYRPLSRLRIFASFNRSLRLPTFTELYYKGPVNIGNSQLKPEESWSAETGMKYSGKLFRVDAAIFYRYSYNLIDWIQYPGSVIWNTENLTNISTAGFEASAGMDLKDHGSGRSPLQHLGVSYAYLDMRKNSEGYISYYVMDYLRHSADLTADIRIFNGCLLVLGTRWYSRAGSFISYPSGIVRNWPAVFLADAGLHWTIKETEFRLDAFNLFNVAYQEYANIPMPGFNFRASAICRIGLKN